MLIKWLTVVAATGAASLAYVLAPSAEAPPELADIQTAYQREASTIGAKHDAGLKVVGADCSRDLSGEYLCWVKFTGSSDQHKSVQSDVVSIARLSRIWKLKSGLCLPAS